jgi:hypothetical protein
LGGASFCCGREKLRPKDNQGQKTQKQGRQTGARQGKKGPAAGKAPAPQGRKIPYRPLASKENFSNHPTGRIGIRISALFCANLLDSSQKMDYNGVIAMTIFSF